MVTENESKKNKKLPESKVISGAEADPKLPARVVFEIDQTDALTWTAYQHTVVDNKIVATEVISKDIKILTKKKLERRMFAGS